MCDVCMYIRMYIYVCTVCSYIHVVCVGVDRCSWVPASNQTPLLLNLHFRGLNDDIVWLLSWLLTFTVADGPFMGCLNILTEAWSHSV